MSVQDTGQPRDLQDLLRALTAGPLFVRVGTVERVYRMAGVPWVDVAAHADSALLSGRLVALGGAVRVPVALGDEALVLLPEGQERRAVVLVGLESGRTRQPRDPTTVEITYPAGVDVRRSQERPTEAVALAPLAVDLRAYHAALESGLSAVAAAATGGSAPTVATLAAALAAMAAATNALVANLRASTLAVQGALPPETNPYTAKALRSE